MVTVPFGRLLDRVPRFDERSRAYGVARGLEAVRQAPLPRSMTYACATALDQGPDGACVGHAFAHDAAARPVVRAVSSADAFGLYHLAQTLDGQDWASGTSILAGAQAYVQRGYATGYRWAFSLQELIIGLGWHGPAVIGVWWWTSMFTPSADGMLTVSGQREGGHAVLVRQVHVVWKPGTRPADKRRPDWLDLVDLDRSWALIHNSWGGTWGHSGTARISLHDLWFRLLKDEGETCFPTGRRQEARVLTGT